MVIGGGGLRVGITEFDVWFNYDLSKIRMLSEVSQYGMCFRICIRIRI